MPKRIIKKVKDMKEKIKEEDKERRKPKWEEEVADIMFLFIKPLEIVADWLANMLIQAEKSMRKRRDYVLVLIVLLTLILIAIIIPLLNALMKAG